MKTTSRLDDLVRSFGPEWDGVSWGDFLDYSLELNHRRFYDQAIWPMADKGYFPDWDLLHPIVKERIREANQEYQKGLQDLGEKIRGR